MRLINADHLKAMFMKEYEAYRKRGADVTLYDFSYTLGNILEMVDSTPTVLFQIGNNVAELETEDDDE